MEPEEDQFEVIDAEEDYEGPNQDGHAAPITVLATSTTNALRPRTLRAGYEYKTHTLTVIFRDGRWYNYYDVPVSMWEEFRDAPSKGKYLASSGLDNWQSKGYANVGVMNPAYREALSRSRYAQLGMSKKSKTSGKYVTTYQFRKIRGVRGIEAIKRGRVVGQQVSFEDRFEH